MLIIEKEAYLDHWHRIEDQPHRKEVWMEGYIEVPETHVFACMGYCDLVIEDGVLTGIIPYELPPPAEAEPNHIEFIAGLMEGYGDE